MMEEVSSAQPAVPSIFSKEGALQALGNVPSSAGGAVSDIYTAIRHPVETAKGLGTVAAGGVQKLIPGEQSREPAFNALVDFMKQRYGSLEAINRTAVEDPIGSLLDLSSLLGGAGAIARTT